MSERWKARAKGGVLRREFLGYAGRFAGWMATVWASAGAGEFLAQRREQTKKMAPLKAQTGDFVVLAGTATLTITGTANLQLGPMTASGTGTVTNPPA